MMREAAKCQKLDDVMESSLLVSALSLALQCKRRSQSKAFFARNLKLDMKGDINELKSWWNEGAIPAFLSRAMSMRLMGHITTASRGHSRFRIPQASGTQYL